jgi:hypothetical protein
LLCHRKSQLRPRKACAGPKGIADLSRALFIARFWPEEREIWNAGFPAQTNSSRTIEFDRLNCTAMTVNIELDGTTADFAILDRGKRSGRGVDDRGEDSAAVGANNAGLYFKVHANN